MHVILLPFSHPVPVAPTLTCRYTDILDILAITRPILAITRPIVARAVTMEAALSSEMKCVLLTAQPAL